MTQVNWLEGHSFSLYFLFWFFLLEVAGLLLIGWRHILNASLTYFNLDLRRISWLFEARILFLFLFLHLVFDVLQCWWELLHTIIKPGTNWYVWSSQVWVASIVLTFFIRSLGKFLGWGIVILSQLNNWFLFVFFAWTRALLLFCFAGLVFNGRCNYQEYKANDQQKDKSFTRLTILSIF